MQVKTYSDCNLLVHNDFGIELSDLAIHCKPDIHPLHDAIKEHFVPVTSVYSCSPIRVYVLEGSKPDSIITFHDIGTNHESFYNFCNHSGMNVLLNNFTVYHICAPGHHQKAALLSSEVVTAESSQFNFPPTLAPSSTADNKSSSPRRKKLSGGSSPRIFSKQSTAGALYPNMDQLADMVQCVVSHFNLSRVVGFAKGAGANVLLRHALRYPERMLGLFLINPTCGTTGYYELMKAKWFDLPQMQKGILSDGAMALLENQWFGSAKTENHELIDCRHQKIVDNLNICNLAGYVRAYMERDEVPLVRPSPGNTATQTGVLQVECFLVTGNLCRDFASYVSDLNAKLDPKRTQYITVTDANGMLMDEFPEKMMLLLLGFLRNIGLVVTLTPEMLKQQVNHRQKTFGALKNNKLFGHNDDDLGYTSHFVNESVASTSGFRY